MNLMRLEFSKLNDFRAVVTPAIAAYWLQHHNNINRKLRANNQNRYARLMKSGLWGQTHQGIAFDWNGEMIDGGHRLEAIVESGMAQEILITVGLDPGVRGFVDQGAPRSIADVARLSENGHLVCGIAASTGWAAWRAMVGHLGGRPNRAHPEVISFANAHRDAGLFAMRAFGEHPKCTGILVGPIVACVARAFYHYQNTEALKVFVQVLCTGIMRHPSHESAVRCRNKLLTATIGKNSNANTQKYSITARGISAHMEGRIITRFQPYSEEPYPLPESTAQARLVSDQVYRDTGGHGARGRGTADVADQPGALE